ncbi:MAG TPA: hypothetical protein VHZ51_07290 [Ktedonobacteraceae bacterium]|nr:hypothetical protein [Ktedonobacteraceae bacterium]
MSLLRAIQNGATEDSVSLGSLLRKVKLLASRMGVREIGEWAERELSGYDSTEGLPPYRGPFNTIVLGNAMGPFGRELRNFPIPPMALSEKFRDEHLFKLDFLQGVAELESLVAAKQTVRVPWDADVVMMFSILAEGGTVKIDPSMAFIQIWKEVPHTTIVGVLDAVRNRLLDFTMQIGEEEPSAEDEQRITDPKRVKRTANVFNNIIYAASANIAIGNRDVTQTQELPEPFDSNGLMDYLRKVGLNDDMIDELQDALDEDAKEEDENGEDDEPKKPGRRVLTWLKNVSTAATTQVGAPVATTLITQALLHYFRF